MSEMYGQDFDETGHVLRHSESRSLLRAGGDGGGREDGGVRCLWMES